VFDPKRVRAILFDIDGTLADTDDEYIRRALRWLGPVRWLFPRRDPTPFLRWGVMTVESPANFVLSLPDWLGVDDELVALSNWFADRRGASPVGHFVLMEGAPAMLKQLAAHYRLAVVTARSAQATEEFLDQFGMRAHFQAIASAQTAEHTKPYPDPVIWAAGALGVAVEECVMVGDTTVDIRAGRAAGAQTVGVLCGFGERAELEGCGADLILERTIDLPQWLPQP